MTSSTASTHVANQASQSRRRKLIAGIKLARATSCSIGVNNMKFSRLISVTSTSARRANALSKYVGRAQSGEPATSDDDSDLLHAVTGCTTPNLTAPVSTI